VRTGALEADEAGEPALTTTGPARARLRVRLALLQGGAQSGRRVVLHGHGVQYVAEMRDGDVFERSLPRPRAELQHDPSLGPDIGR
jgi:hypothetical protein